MYSYSALYKIQIVHNKANNFAFIFFNCKSKFIAALQNPEASNRVAASSRLRYGANVLQGSLIKTPLIYELPLNRRYHFLVPGDQRTALATEMFEGQ